MRARASIVVALIAAAAASSPRPAAADNEDVVLAKIQAAYMRGIRRCYSDHRETHPDAQGVIKLELTVDTRGRSIGNKATGFAPALDACIMRGMARWRFPLVRDRAGTPVATPFAITLELRP